MSSEFAVGVAGRNNGPLRPQPCRMRVNSNIMPRMRMTLSFIMFESERARLYDGKPRQRTGQRAVCPYRADGQRTRCGHPPSAWTAMHCAWNLPTGSVFSSTSTPGRCNVWLAARSGGIEFIHRNGTWRAHDQSELFARLRENIEQTISQQPSQCTRRPPAAPATTCPPCRRSSIRRRGKATDCETCLSCCWQSSPVSGQHRA